MFACLSFFWYEIRSKSYFTTSLVFMSNLQSVNGLVAYLTCCFIARAGFKALNHQLEAIHMRNSNELTIIDEFQRDKLNRELLKWRRDFLFLNDITENINKCFSSLLFFWIVIIFLYFVPCCYYLVQAVLRQGEVLITELTLWSLLNLTALTVKILVITTTTTSLLTEVTPIC